MLDVGDKIPHFSLQTDKGIEFRSEEVLKEGPLVLFFYPKDFTPGCTAEVCNFRDNFQAFYDLGAKVAGISSDSPEIHKKFTGRFNLPYPLLTDKEGQLANKFEIKRPFFNLWPGRATFVIDQRGVIQMAYANILASKHHAKALEAIRKLKD